MSAAGGRVTGLAQRTFNMPTTIPSDGSVDVTEQVNAWLDSVPDGTEQRPSTAVFAAGGIYRIDGTVSANGRLWLNIDGNGATLDWSQNTPVAMVNRAGIKLTGSAGCRVGHLTIIGPWVANWQDGYDSAFEFQHGIALFGSNRCVVHDNVIINSLGDSVSMPGSDDCIVIDNVCEGAGRMGVALTANRRTIIQGNTFDRIGYHVLDLEPEAEGHPVIDVTVDGNTIKLHRFSFVAAAAGICSPRTGYSITDNIMENSGITSMPPIDIASTVHSTTLPEGQCTDNEASSFTITGNTLRSTTNNLAAVKVRTLTDVVVNDNLIYLDAPFSDRAIVTFDTCGGTLEVKRNTCAGVPNAYRIDGVNHGLGVDSCGNTTSGGTNVPTPCV